MIDRSEFRRTDPEWLAEAWGRARVFAVHGGRVSAMSDTPSGLPGGGLASADAAARLFLGVDGEGTPYFAVMSEVPDMTLLREVLLDPPSDLFVELALAAVALANWHESHLFHPRTGHPTRPVHAGWVQQTEAGDLTWPRTNPAVLVLIHDGVTGDNGRILLSRNVARPGNVRSVTAGFVSPGESLEGTVARESFEELGVVVSDIRYVASEGWPFADELMVGFTALADPDQPLVLDPAEIAEAEWRTRAELRSSDVLLPARISISRMMIDNWLAGKLP
ncbi:putative NADH pyrophosphatase/NUDIX hydrolase [Longispora fulva]|uniref:NAD(+) diphosphatase n=1 Tax=Longispora fulva TaxID=619741 RepID=A0A8J7GQK4_9ACTN|nr:NAD(+) diphosphatase [Longispora fulva]MBG6138770.1 NAD+ diphosphatase [Longispora fulva]GIG58265.1 putative NADH pyrophosphatase/NUDIX hydrolase [Longispora fulva]